MRFGSMPTTSGFQPTLPVRGVTVGRGMGTMRTNISTHTPRAGSDNEPIKEGEGEEISTHTPRAGSDAKLFSSDGDFEDFNPHSPCGE